MPTIMVGFVNFNATKVFLIFHIIKYLMLNIVNYTFRDVNYTFQEKNITFVFIFKSDLMRKILLSAGLILFLFSCSNKVQQENIITVTIEPQRYFAEQLADSLFRIECMVPVGTSPETYDPTPAQMAKLARSKAYFCIGHIGFEEVWIDKLKQNYPYIPFFDNSEGISLINVLNRTFMNC